MDTQGDMTSSSSAFSALSDIVEKEVAIVNSPKEESTECQVELTEQDERITNLVLSLSKSKVGVVFYLLEQDASLDTTTVTSELSQRRSEQVRKKVKVLCLRMESFSQKEVNDDPAYDSDYEYNPGSEKIDDGYEGRKRSHPKPTPCIVFRICLYIQLRLSRLLKCISCYLPYWSLLL